MATLKELRDERLRKLKELKKAGINPYPAKVNRSNFVDEISKKFDELAGKEVTVVGRILRLRKIGQIAFIVEV
jgi:lysyl-tRNA synthetase class 2